MAESVPLTPMGREEIHKLETALLIGTLFRPDVLKAIKDASERITWIDSLAVAAAALARHKAGIPVTQIAEEIGRTEATVRNHLQGKTEAGKLVQQTYEMLKEKGLQLPVLDVEDFEKIPELKQELQEAKSELQRLKSKVSEYESELQKYRDVAAEVLKALEDTSRRLREILE